MIITHVLDSLSLKGGGLPAAVKALAYQQTQLGIVVNIVCFNVDSNQINNCGIKIFSEHEYVDELIFNKVDIIHIHGVWNFRSLLLLRRAKARGIITILSAHGQLMPTLLNSDKLNKKIKKKFYIKTLLSIVHKYVDVIHSICNEEEKVLKKVFYKSKHVSIFNYIDNEFILSSCCSELYSRSKWEKEKVITFIGRIEPRKGLGNLVLSFIEYKKKFPKTKISINIVGPVDDYEHLGFLNKVISESISDGSILISGPVYGKDKVKLIENSSFICLPSYSEVIGLVNIEGALMKRVVITTHQAHIPEIGMHGGYIIDNDIDIIISLLDVIERLTYEDYVNRAISLNEWAMLSFNKESINKKWIDLFTSQFNLKI